MRDLTQPRTTQSLFEIEGTLELVGRPPRPVFSVGEPPKQIDSGTPLDAPPAASPERRRVVLGFDPATFPDLVEGIDVLLPPDIERESRFLEIGVALEVAGDVEAQDLLNDVLDVPVNVRSPPPVPAFALRVLDDAGEPLAGISVDFSVAGQDLQLVTNEQGLARFHGDPSSLAAVRFPEAQSLKARLKPLWNTARPIKRTPPDVERIALGGDIDERILERDRPLIVSLFPRVERARLLRFFFDTNKTFLLPDADGGQAIKTLQQLYERNKPGKLLVVGHADTAGGASYNDKLSLDRAQTVLDYLRDDVDGWLKWYGTDIESKKRWGAGEDLLMIAALPDAGTRDATEAPFTWFQRTRKLSRIDGKTGPETRKALVKEYMSLDTAKLPDEIAPTVHGCGENFPEVKTPDATAEPDNRRVELFFFDQELGIQPPPEGRNSDAKAKDYPEWVRRASLVDALGTRLRSLVIRVLDSLNQPLANAPFELEVGSEKRSGKTDDNGFLHERELPAPNRCILKWGFPLGDGDDEDASGMSTPELVFQRSMFLDYAETDESDRNEAASRRLSNLGYLDLDLDANVAQFQKDFKLQGVKGLDQTTFDELRKVHDDL